MLSTTMIGLMLIFPPVIHLIGKPVIGFLINDFLALITVLEDSDRVFRSLCAGAGGYTKKTLKWTILKSIAEAFAGGAPISLSIARIVVQPFNCPQDSPLSEREKRSIKGYSLGKNLFQARA